MNIETWLSSFETWLRSFEAWISFFGSAGSLAAIWLAIVFYRSQKTDQKKMAQELGDALAGKTESILGQVSQHIGLTKEQGEQARRLTDEVQQILDAVYTKFAGKYPDYLDYLPGLIGEAKQSLKIMALIGSHGEYSDCEGRWFRIHRAIEDKMHERCPDGSRIQATLLRSEYTCAINAFQAHHGGLKNKDSWDAWRAEEIIKGRLPKFVDTHKDLTAEIREDFANLDLDSYIRLRINADRETSHHVYRDFLSILETTERLPMYCWIVDDKKAIFSIRTEDTKGHYVGAGVTTSDPELVALLDRMIDYYARDAKKADVNSEYRFV